MGDGLVDKGRVVDRGRVEGELVERERVGGWTGSLSQSKSLLLF